jgi:excinuclease ABC subunit B
VEPSEASVAADPVIQYMSRDQLERLIKETDYKMKKAAKELDFMSAAQFRDELFALKKKLKESV